MSEVLLVLALSTCAAGEGACTYTQTSDATTVVTVCGLAPEKEGDALSLEYRVKGQDYLFVLEPKCNDV